MINQTTMAEEENKERFPEVHRLKEIRCTNIRTFINKDGHKVTTTCNRKLAVGNIGSGGMVEFHCERCGRMYRIMKIP